MGEALSQVSQGHLYTEGRGRAVSLVTEGGGGARAISLRPTPSPLVAIVRDKQLGAIRA